MRNVLIDRLDPRAELILGSPRRLGQLEGLDDSYGALFLVGYHTRHGAGGVLSHTTNGQAVANVWIGDELVGEIGLNARLAGSFGVPVALVTGDDRTVAEAKEQLPEVEGVVVKKALGRYTARCLHPERAQQLIEQGAVRAVKKADRLGTEPLGSPVSIRVQFKETGSAEAAAAIPGAVLVADDTVELSCDSVEQAYAGYSSMVALWEPAWGGWIRG